jgi:hypothetical protein
MKSVVLLLGISLLPLRYHKDIIRDEIIGSLYDNLDKYLGYFIIVT